MPAPSLCRGAWGAAQAFLFATTAERHLQITSELPHFPPAGTQPCGVFATLQQQMKQTVTPPARVRRRSSSLQPVLLQQIAGGEASQTDLKHGVLRTWSLRRAQLAGQSPQNFNTLLEWHFLLSVPTVSA